MEFSKRHLDDLARVVQKYEQSIADLDAGEPEKDVAARWEGYGGLCSLCCSAERWEDPPSRCRCILGWSCHSGQREARKTFDNMIDMADGDGSVSARTALAARLAWIKKRVEENGYELIG